MFIVKLSYICMRVFRTPFHSLIYQDDSQTAAPYNRKDMRTVMKSVTWDYRLSTQSFWRDFVLISSNRLYRDKPCMFSLHTKEIDSELLIITKGNITGLYSVSLHYWEKTLKRILIMLYS